MRYYVSVTDNDWFNFLAERRPDEVNFWRPGGHSSFAVLGEGEPFLFKLHAPLNYIVGGGFFVRFTTLPLSMAWKFFGEENGCSNYQTLRSKIFSYIHRRADVEGQHHSPSKAMTFPPGRAIPQSGTPPQGQKHSPTCLQISKLPPCCSSVHDYHQQTGDNTGGLSRDQHHGYLGDHSPLAQWTRHPGDCSEPWRSSLNGREAAAMLGRGGSFARCKKLSSTVRIGLKSRQGSEWNDELLLDLMHPRVARSLRTVHSRV